MKPMDALITKLERHSRLDGADKSTIRLLSCHYRELESDQDFIRQGDKPTESAILVEGVAARYQNLSGGRRQYLSFHMAGDMPDAQGLFLEVMDHAVCAVGPAAFCAVPHAELIKIFKLRPNVGFAIWRETLIDASIFRAAITNIGARAGAARIAHLLSEFFYRARFNKLTKDSVCALPISQTQLGETVGMSIATVSRHLATLRKSGAATLTNGKLNVQNPSKLFSIGEFDPSYLHMTAT